MVILTYPIISSRQIASSHERLYQEYKDSLEATPDEEIAAAWADAANYNQYLSFGKHHRIESRKHKYEDMLDIAQSDVMGYVSIPKIDVMLPIYQDSGDTSTLEAAWHMRGSSLPIGGESTRSVICAHSAFPSSPLFSDLELLQVGDTFQIEVLGELLTYKIFDIEVILPEQVESLFVRDGEDLATLVTCTPLGQTTHRLLVHGSRVPTEGKIETEQTKSIWLWNIYQRHLTTVVLVVVVVLVLTGILLFVIIPRMNRKKKIS